MTTITAQSLNIQQLEEYETRLYDVMEITDKQEVKKKLMQVEQNYQLNPNLINSVRLGLIYHEVAFNLSFSDTSKTYQGYAQKSYNTLTRLNQDHKTKAELKPFIESYRASALALVSAETRKLSLVGKAFAIFEQAVVDYAEYSPRPEFLRGSVAENLPFFMWKKRAFAKKDFTSIIAKYEENPDYADYKIMSFTYWAWANQHRQKKYRSQALAYLDKAILLDPNYEAGREKGEKLKVKLEKK